MRKEFSKAVKWKAYNRCLIDGKPHCEICGFPIIGLPEFDHRKADGLGGEPTLENCQVACGKCHRQKTIEHDRPVMAKADRQKKSAANIKRKYKWPKRRFGQ